MAELLTPVGRMVQGDPFTAQTKDQEGRPLVDHQGQPRVSYFFAIAIPKNCPEWPQVMQAIQAEAMSGFPGGQYNSPTFAWKVLDGDDPKHAHKEGFAGHYVLRCSGGFAPKVYKKGANGYEQILQPDPMQLKRGDYIRAYLNIKANGSVNKPGVYLNPNMIEVCGYGQEIVSGPDAGAVFGGTPSGQLPPGASATPVASSTAPAAGGMPGGMPGAPAAGGMPGGMPGAPAAGGMPGAPAAGGMPGMMPGTVTPPPAGQMTPPPAAPVKTMTEKAGGATYEQMIASGWNDQLLIEHGYMLNTAPGATPAPGFLNSQ